MITDRQDKVSVGMVLPSPPANSRRPAVATAAVRVKLSVFCQALASVLSAASSRPALRVVPRAFEDYDRLLEAVSEGQVEFAWLPPIVAARASADGGITPLVVPLRGEQAWYASALFSAPNSPIRSTDDLKGTRIAWVDRKSMGGYVVMRAWLRSCGIDPALAFSEESFQGSHEQVVAAVLEGQADVGATFVHQQAEGDAIISAGWGDANVQVITVAGRIPSDVLAAKAGVDATLLAAVHDALTGEMDMQLRGAALALFEADRFAKADESAMRSLADLIVHWAA